MATFTVRTIRDEVANDGTLSLREAVARANAAQGVDSIAFAPQLEGKRLVLTGGQLVATDDLRVDGNRDDNRSQVAIDAGGEGRALTVGGVGTSVHLEGLVVSGGRIAPGAADPNGGGILLAAGNELTLAGCTVEGNRVGGFQAGPGGDYQRGGGVHAGAGSRLTVSDSLLQGNAALGFGGAIYAAADARVVISGSELVNNDSYDGGGAVALNNAQSLTLTGSTIGYNSHGSQAAGGGGILLFGSTATIADSTLFGNATLRNFSGGAIFSAGSRVELTDSTIAANRAGYGAGVYSDSGSGLVLRGCTVTGNVADYADGGISSRGRLEVANSIVAGNSVDAFPYAASDVAGAVTVSNGHNLFGSNVLGNVAGDREGIAPDRLFAVLDAGDGGGRLGLYGGPTRTVRLRDALDNPALSGADPLDSDGTDQRGVARPLPPATNPDIGSFELDQRQVSRSPSANNDVLSGDARADALAALAGNDLVRGLAGSDRLQGMAGSDTLDGGTGGDLLEGDSASDLLRGGDGNDRLLGGPNRDTLFGGGGNDRFGVDPGDSGVGANRRDVIGDFARGADQVDLATFDAVASGGGVDDVFAFIGRQAFTGAGQLRFTRAGGDTVVQGSTDADSAPEFELQLAGDVALAASDFVL